MVSRSAAPIFPTACSLSRRGRMTAVALAPLPLNTKTDQSILGWTLPAQNAVRYIEECAVGDGPEHSVAYFARPVEGLQYIVSVLGAGAESLSPADGYQIKLTEGSIRSANA